MDVCLNQEDSSLSIMALAFLSFVHFFIRWRQNRHIHYLQKETKDQDPDDLGESGMSSSWGPNTDTNGKDDFGEDIELQELPKARASVKGPSTSQHKQNENQSDSSSPERPPEPTSVVRRRSSVGIQRQASVCLSDEEDQAYEVSKRPPTDIPDTQKRVAAIVHRSANGKQQEIPAVASTSTARQPPPFLHSHSTPDAVAANVKPGVSSSISLHKLPTDTLARVVDLEGYHYSSQQVWQLALQGAALLKDKSHSDLDEDAWNVDLSIQKTVSTERGLLEQGLEQHQIDHLRLLLTGYSPVDDDDVKVWSKVRYNDTGSREDIREEVIEMISGESSDDSHSSIESEIFKQQSRQLWQLRASLEEEEDKLSDTQETECDPPDKDTLDPQDALASGATSFESNPDVSCDDPGYECDDSDYLQLPSHELRRHCYKGLLSKRMQKRGTESSFDSVESSSTDRTEGATTSFESTTDNTDSTGEGQTNRLQQMKADSGYKSMESNGKAPRLCRKQLQFNVEGDSMRDSMLDSMSLDRMTTMEGTFDEESEQPKEPITQIKQISKAKSSIETSKVVSFEGVTIECEGLPPCEPLVHKRKYKSALKKHCTESDAQWSEKMAEVETKGKTSVFQRFFRSGRFRFEHMHQFRDYSIDEKSDALFREFSRPEGEGDLPRRRLHSHIRMHHRSSESSSPHLPRKVLSPQVSIEEESCESAGEDDKRTEESDKRESTSPEAQIPVICLSHGAEEQS